MRNFKGQFIKGSIKSKDWIERSRLKMIGNKNPFYGKKHTPETVMIIKQKRKLQLPRKDFRQSKESKEKNRLAHIGKNTGSKNNNWKGGITPVNEKIRHSSEYKLWRKSVFERDGYVCVWCGIKSKKGVTVMLHADHIKPFWLFPELRFAIDNGRTLCISCHKKTDTYGEKAKYYKLN